MKKGFCTADGCGLYCRVIVAKMGDGLNDDGTVKRVLGRCREHGEVDLSGQGWEPADFVPGIEQVEIEHGQY